METRTDRGIKELRETIKNHLDNSKLLDTIKDKMNLDEKSIAKLKDEGLLNQVLGELQQKLSGKGKSIIGGYEISKASNRYAEHKDKLDPNRRYMIIKCYRGSAFVDYIEPRSDEYLTLSISYLNQRYSSSPVTWSTDPVFDLTIHFEIPEAYDSHTMLKSYSPLIVVVQKQRVNSSNQKERPIILSTSLVDWRELLSHNSIDVNIGNKISP